MPTPYIMIKTEVDVTEIRYIHSIWHVAPKKIFCFFVLSRAFSPS